MTLADPEMLGIDNFKVVGLRRWLGMEFEIGDYAGLIVSGHNPERFGFRYSVGHDSSVKPSGLEVVTEPLVGDAVFNAIMEFTGRAREEGCVVNDTCGFHVHVDAGRFTARDVLATMWAYWKWEEDVYGLVRPSRGEKYYCWPWRGRGKKKKYHMREDWVYPFMDQEGLERLEATPNERELMRGLVEVFYGVKPPLEKGITNTVESVLQTINDLKGSRYGLEGQMLYRRFVEKWGADSKVWVPPYGLNASDYFNSRELERLAAPRYAGLNFHAWFYRGTIEWRQKEMTLVDRELVMWTLFCGWFVEVAWRRGVTWVKKCEGMVEFLGKDAPQAVVEWVEEKLKERKEMSMVKEVKVEEPTVRRARRTVAPPIGWVVPDDLVPPDVRF